MVVEVDLRVLQAMNFRFSCSALLAAVLSCAVCTEAIADSVFGYEVDGAEGTVKAVNFVRANAGNFGE